jgi:hypothetical protein
MTARSSECFGDTIAGKLFAAVAFTFIAVAAVVGFRVILWTERQERERERREAERREVAPPPVQKKPHWWSRTP